MCTGGSRGAYERSDYPYRSGAPPLLALASYHETSVASPVASPT
jgi:hypothetical protein